MKNCGFSEQEAKQIEARYHELYEVSDTWVQDKLQAASKNGYITAAFGLRVRTPLLKQVVFGSRNMPFEAAAEGRTAGNALGQSYCLLNNRAAAEFQSRVWASPYRLRIRLISLIHDAIYPMWEDDIDVTMWVNKNLVECMQWQDLPELDHPTVKIGAELDIFWPSWKYPLTIPNNATEKEIRTLAAAHIQKFKP